jgi:hypothetical protein
MAHTTHISRWPFDSSNLLAVNLCTQLADRPETHLKHQSIHTPEYKSYSLSLSQFKHHYYNVHVCGIEQATRHVSQFTHFFITLSAHTALREDEAEEENQLTQKRVKKNIKT